MKNEFEKYMNKALALAARAEAQDEVPVGAIIVKDGHIIGRGWNRRQQKQNALEHAEIMAIAQACRKLKSWRLEGCTLFVTLEPCPMCAGAIIQSRIQKVVFGAYDTKGGAAGSVVNLFAIPQWNHHPQWEGGILEYECSKQLKNYFKKKRELKKAEKLARRIANSEINPAVSSRPYNDRNSSESVRTMGEDDFTALLADSQHITENPLKEKTDTQDLERAFKSPKGD